MKEFTGKVIKVGSSLAITLPAKEAKTQHITQGDEVKFGFELNEIKNNTDNMSKEYERFKKTYGKTLKNLADR